MYAGVDGRGYILHIPHTPHILHIPHPPYIPHIPHIPHTECPYPLAAVDGEGEGAGLP
jgi:hypothetical protein